ncbi:MAG: hypothetical protein LQ347_006463 [Umbilicaria vellea]|nr:MAG: hypothetical protein LQ347_006463 [Umbilicaria vellea]
MEEDRAQTNIAEAINVELEASPVEVTKQPKKRFIGRRAAAERAGKHGDPNSTIEDSGAIQASSSPKPSTASGPPSRKRSPSNFPKASSCSRLPSLT